jgi:pimeloyl-ACP methyl ester carboxylesterase
MSIRTSRHLAGWPLAAALILLGPITPAGAASLAEHATSDAMARPPAEPDKILNLTFVSEGATLSGTLFLPQGRPIVAAAVLVQGAGRDARDVLFGRPLARLGLALFVYDKRGVGKSGGVYAGPEVGTNNVSRENLVLLQDDAAAAFTALDREAMLRGVPRGFIGISQAGWIVPAAARKVRAARFMVFFSGAAETTHEDVLFEHRTVNDPGFWDHHTHEEVRSMLKDVVDPFRWPDFDPRNDLEKLKIPGLWIYGGRDRNVDVDLCIERLGELAAHGHPNFEYRVYPSYDHFLGHEGPDVLVPAVKWIQQTGVR